MLEVEAVVLLIGEYPVLLLLAVKVGEAEEKGLAYYSA